MPEIEDSQVRLEGPQHSPNEYSLKDDQEGEDAFRHQNPWALLKLDSFRHQGQKKEDASGKEARQMSHADYFQQKSIFQNACVLQIETSTFTGHSLH